MAMTKSSVFACERCNVILPAHDEDTRVCPECGDTMLKHTNNMSMDLAQGKDMTGYYNES